MADKALPRVADLSVQVVQLIQISPQPFCGAGGQAGVARFELFPHRRAGEFPPAKRPDFLQKIFVDVRIALVRTDGIQPFFALVQGEVFQPSVPYGGHSVQPCRMPDDLFDFVRQAEGQDFAAHAPAFAPSFPFERVDHPFAVRPDRLCGEIRFAVRTVEQVFRPVAQTEQIRICAFGQFFVVYKVKETAVFCTHCFPSFDGAPRVVPYRIFIIAYRGAKKQRLSRGRGGIFAGARRRPHAVRAVLYIASHSGILRAKRIPGMR